MLLFCHLEQHDIAILMELFNLSVAGVDIPATWKNSVIIPILKAGKPQEQGRTYRKFSLLCLAAKSWSSTSLSSWKLWEHASSKHNLKQKHSTTSTLLHISVRVVLGFNQRNRTSRTIAIAVDISKSFNSTVSRHLIIKINHCSRLQHNLVRWLVAYLCGRKALCLYQ